MTSRAGRALLVGVGIVVMALVVGLAASRALPVPSPVPSPSGPIARALSARIVVSLPFRGPRRAQSEGVANAVRLAVEQVNARVNTGDLSISLDVDILDSANPDGTWSESAERANADRAASDRSVIAYVGPSTIEGAKAIAPILASTSLLALAPTLTHPALTLRGYDDGLYDTLHPNGVNVFLRTIPSDEVAAKTMLKWAKDRQLTPVSASADTDTWSRAFLAAANAERLVSNASPRFLYLGGMAADRAGAVLKGMSQRPTAGGAESLLSDAFLRGAGASAEGVVATFAGRPLEHYSGDAAAFARSYRDRFLINPDPYAIFGYDAGRLLLDGVRRSRQGAIVDRGAVRDAAFGARDLEGALGKWSVDPQGDSTYTTLQLYVVKALPGGALAWSWDSEVRP